MAWGGCRSIWIPGWFPLLTNKLTAWQLRYKSSGLKKQDAETVARACRAHGFARMDYPTGPVRVSAIFILPPKRRSWDGDAWLKSTLDALVKAEIMKDDGMRYARSGTTDFARSMFDISQGTLLFLEVQP